MKGYRNAAAALVLAVTFTTSAFAGEMHTDAPTASPTVTANGEMHTGAPEGEMQTGEAASAPRAADTVTEVALNLLQSVFALT
jgi:hypothetical protein